MIGRSIGLAPGAPDEPSSADPGRVSGEVGWRPRRSGWSRSRSLGAARLRTLVRSELAPKGPASEREVRLMDRGFVRHVSQSCATVALRKPFLLNKLLRIKRLRGGWWARQKQNRTVLSGPNPKGAGLSHALTAMNLFQRGPHHGSFGDSGEGGGLGGQQAAALRHAALWPQLPPGDPEMATHILI